MTRQDDATTTGESHDSVEAEPTTVRLDTATDDSLTTNRKLRWDLLASLVAGAACVSLLALIVAAALGVATLAGIPQGFFLLYATVVLTSCVWTFGAEALGKAKEAMQGE